MLFKTNAKPEKIQVDNLEIQKQTKSLGVVIFLFKIGGSMKTAFK